MLEGGGKMLVVLENGELWRLARDKISGGGDGEEGKFLGRGCE